MRQSAGYRLNQNMSHSAWLRVKHALQRRVAMRHGAPLLLLELLLKTTSKDLLQNRTMRHSAGFPRVCQSARFRRVSQPQGSRKTGAAITHSAITRRTAIAGAGDEDLLLR